MLLGADMHPLRGCQHAVLGRYLIDPGRDPVVVVETGLFLDVICALQVLNPELDAPVFLQQPRYRSIQ